MSVLGSRVLGRRLLRRLARLGHELAEEVHHLQELRRRASERLGPDFDIRHFHDQVLDTGALPLDVLEAKIDRWLMSGEAAQ